VSAVFVWDASPFVHASRIDRLDVLGDLARGPTSDPWQHHTTAAVAQEVATQGQGVPDWLKVVHVDAIGELRALGKWIDLVSSDTHSQGEATVLAWAECHGATAILDDSEARRVARAHGLAVHGVVWMAAQAVNQGRWSATSVSGFLDQMIASGARYPFESSAFEAWAHGKGLLQ
jgi:predicted nucleic acid-binding protein